MRTGSYQSPALGFLNEVVHFLHEIKNPFKMKRANSMRV